MFLEIFSQKNVNNNNYKPKNNMDFHLIYIIIH